MGEATYTISTYFGDGDWHVECSRITKWEIRAVLRKLYGLGWDTCSILVERDECHERGLAVSQ